MLVHGAGSGPWIFDSWLDAFPGLDVRAVDLPVSAGASMDDYAAAIAGAAARVRGPFAVCGWSMGGLAAMMAARETQPDHLVLLEPSPPAEIQGSDKAVEFVDGMFDPEEAYARSHQESARGRSPPSLGRNESAASPSAPSQAARSSSTATRSRTTAAAGWRRTTAPRSSSSPISTTGA